MQHGKKGTREMCLTKRGNASTVHIIIVQDRVHERVSGDWAGLYCLPFGPRELLMILDTARAAKMCCYKHESIIAIVDHGTNDDHQMNAIEHSICNFKNIHLCHEACIQRKMQFVVYIYNRSTITHYNCKHGKMRTLTASMPFTLSLAFCSLIMMKGRPYSSNAKFILYYLCGCGIIEEGDLNRADNNNPCASPRTQGTHFV